MSQAPDTTQRLTHHPDSKRRMKVSVQIFDLIKLGGWWDVLLMETIEGRADLEGGNHSQVRGLLGAYCISKY